MEDDKICWCFKQKKGIKLIDINLDIVESYIKKSEESLIMIEVSTTSWKYICSYYACYDILYALLQRYGIKCEIHDCSIELLKLFSEFDKNDFDFLTNLKKNRIYAQYYVNKTHDILEINKIKKFVLRVKEIIIKTKDSDINLVLEKLNSYLD